MNFDPIWLATCLLISAIGVACFLWGRRQARSPQMIGGVILIAAPYFFSTLGPMLGFCAGVLGTMWIVARFDR